MEEEKNLTIYLVRGLSRESGHWGGFITFLQAEFPYAELELLDLPGAGKYHQERAQYRISSMVDFLRNKHPLRENRINIIVASSLGGMLAMDWVQRYPNDFIGIVTMNSSFKSICTASERIKPSIRLHLLKIMLHKNLNKREKIILNINSNTAENKTNILNDWIKIQQLRRVKKSNIFAQAVAGFSYAPKKEKLHIPLLILGSKQDKMVCTKCIEKTQNVFGGVLVWHETAGHCIPLDEPEWVSKQIKLWFTNFKY